MATKKDVLKANKLEALGARRLAELLIRLSARDTSIGDFLRLELAGAEGPANVILEVRKQIADMRRLHSFIERDETPDFADDLDDLHNAIVEHVVGLNAKEALDLMWSFMELAGSIYDRCDDSDGTVGEVFRTALRDLGKIADVVQGEPTLLADRVFTAIFNNDYAQYDDLVSVLKPALRREGLSHLKQRVSEFLDASTTELANENSSKLPDFGLDSISEEQWRERARLDAARIALQDIADAQGDVDGFIEQYDEETRKLPRVSAQIAQRLLAAGRAEQALQMLDASSQRDATYSPWYDFEWEDTRIKVLEKLGQDHEAQKVRWNCFELSLSKPHIRDYLQRLADSDASAVEGKALDYVLEFEYRLAALSFLLSWPDLDRASELVVEHASSLDGDRYEVLAPAAVVLGTEYPLATTLVLRAMIDFTLSHAKSTRYWYAARDLSKCSSLADDIVDFQSYETHVAYEQRLRREHGRKRKFWNLFD